MPASASAKTSNTADITLIAFMQDVMPFIEHIIDVTSSAAMQQNKTIIIGKVIIKLSRSVPSSLSMPRLHTNHINKPVKIIVNIAVIKLLTLVISTSVC